MHLEIVTLDYVGTFARWVQPFNLFWTCNCATVSASQIIGAEAVLYGQGTERVYRSQIDHSCLVSRPFLYRVYSNVGTDQYQVAAKSRMGFPYLLEPKILRL